MQESIAVQGSESIWLARAQKGDSQAFAHLVESYHRAVYNLCYRMLRDEAEAEDAAQETFLRAYKALKHYDDSRPFSTWLLAIAAHYCIDQIRKRRMTLIAIEDLPYPDLSDGRDGPEALLSQREEQRRVQALLQTLGAVDRAAVILYYWYDFSYEEIGETLALSLSAVKSRLHRARLSLAQEWMRQQQTSFAERTKHGEVKSPAL